MPLESFLSDLNPPIERSKSILAKISSPFAKRSTKTFDFDIDLEHPHKTFRPGEVVKGSISLSVFKGFEITHLTVALHGWARVFKHQCTAAEVKAVPDQLVNGQGSHGFEYHGNGIASLFQDEQALCGTGFLKKQVYKFGFELQFPACSLPGTLEFERGAVNYMISATVTRPGAMNPTTTKTCKVKFENTIDIESMYTPKSRAIYLEPLVRRGKVKKVKAAAAPGSGETSGTGTNTLTRQNTSQSMQTQSTSPLRQAPLSPAPSEDTVATEATEVTASSRSASLVERQERSSPRKQSDNSEPRTSTTSNSAQTISATAEITRHGGLPGDLIPVRVKIEHTKAARGIVIATLYRQGRIDMLPALPLASKSKDKKPEYEDVYPKSRTGLGGLYFTNGAPNMAFRKDLTQTSTMMIVDPQSKTADVRFSVKIPDDAFPTIDNVPGNMISFTYQIEVVIDLTGKLGESRLLPSLTTNGPSFSHGAVGNAQLTHDWANNILDTAPLRRTKNVAVFDLPVVVGTEDSRRARQAESWAKGKKSQHANKHEEAYWEYHQWDQQQYPEYDEYYGYNYQGDEWYDEHGNPLYDDWSHQHWPEPNQHTNGHHFAPPLIDESVDEKTRLRRQEEALLPSQPPEEAQSSQQAQALAPSAPMINGSNVSSSPSSSIPITISRASARSAETIIPDPLTPPPSLPDDGTPTEDKQELERRRLMAQASAPPEDDEAGPSNHAPSAPVLDEEEECIAQALHSEGNEALPQYQR